MITGIDGRSVGFDVFICCCFTKLLALLRSHMRGFCTSMVSIRLSMLHESPFLEQEVEIGHCHSPLHRNATNNLPFPANQHPSPKPLFQTLCQQQRTKHLTYPIVKNNAHCLLHVFVRKPPIHSSMSPYLSYCLPSPFLYIHTYFFPNIDPSSSLSTTTTYSSNLPTHSIIIVVVYGIYNAFFTGSRYEHLQPETGE